MNGIKRRGVWVAAILVGLAVVATAAYLLFAPERSTYRDEALPGDAADFVTLRTGIWRDGEPLHHASGGVSVLEGASGRMLRFEDYEATAGPDVYFYLVKDASASTTQAVEGEGRRILVPGGANGGHATVRGTFNVPLPDDVDLTQYAAIVAWCEQYNVLFGSATLDAP